MLAAGCLYSRGEGSDRACRVIGMIAKVDRVEPGSHVGAQLAIVAILEKAQAFAHDFAGGLIHPGFNFLADESFELRSKRYVHESIVAKTIQFGYCPNGMNFIHDTVIDN